MDRRVLLEDLHGALRQLVRARRASIAAANLLTLALDTSTVAVGEEVFARRSVRSRVVAISAWAGWSVVFSFLVDGQAFQG